MDLMGLSFATMNSSSTFLALLGFEANILNRPGEAISPMAVGRAGAVGAAVGAARQHGFHDLLRAGELERLDVQAGFLEVTLSMAA